MQYLLQFYRFKYRINFTSTWDYEKLNKYYIVTLHVYWFVSSAKPIIRFGEMQFLFLNIIRDDLNLCTCFLLICVKLFEAFLGKEKTET